MKSGKLVLAGIASVMLVSAAAIPSLAQQANGEKMPGPRGPMAFAFAMLDTNSDGKITRDEFDADKAKIFAEIDKNGDKKLSYDEVKAWAKDVMAKMPGPGAGPDAPPPPPPPADGKAPPPPPPPGPEKADTGPRGAPDEMDGPRGGWAHGPKGPHGMHHMGPRHMDPRERLAQMFLRADANDDGFISQEEFNVMADRMFTRFDRNGDGVIDMKDMPRMMRDRGPAEPPKKG
ncbi:EF-hand domain-containing protein [Rhizobium sp. C4]|uniref:EF-hand domain-containing protein n=1 Tax=Rhizobium sp. C4 TaxID=1349800 RepID=UPI001E440796|nr:EF-hand domain-containing protein [Rhizobium sp. C4]MCD2174803.1 hypothetical protein [Rhizobium sp. C4]